MTPSWFAHGKQLGYGTMNAFAVVADFTTQPDAKRAALALEAVDVMTRQGWSPMLVAEPDHNDDDVWGWKVFSNKLNGWVGPSPSKMWSDPCTALVEANEHERKKRESLHGAASIG